MRSEKPAELLRLARALAASAEGMTLDAMAAFSNVGRRTIERRRDAIEAVFGPLDRIEDGRQVRFRMPGRGLGRFAVAPTSEELAELENAARACEAGRDPKRAAILRSLDQKVRASLREAERFRLDVDLEARLRGETLARQVGPRPFADAQVFTALREALLAGKIVRFRYGEDRDGALRRHKLIPYGILFAPRYYLVAGMKGKPKPALFRLDRMRDLQVTKEYGTPPEDFDLEAYASGSFGVFQEEPEDIVLRFAPAAAPDARAFLFHPTQAMTDGDDGSLIVRFKAGGLLQIVHHLMTWGAAVTILAPNRLEAMMRTEVAALHEHHGRREAD